MSDGGPPAAVHFDAAWVAAVARSRGVTLSEARAEQIADATRPTLERFHAIVAELRADDDMYEFRRLLIEEAARE